MRQYTEDDDLPRGSPRSLPPFFSGDARGQESDPVGETRDWKQILEAATQGVSEGILLVSKDRTILWANTVAAKQGGLRTEELVGRYCYDVTHHGESPCEPPLHPCPLPELLRTGEPVTVTHTHSGRRGEKVSVEVSTHPIKDEEGELVSYVHVSSDVTERDRAQEALRVAREALENGVERGLQRRNAYGLTFRELTVLRLVAGGKSDKEIGMALGITTLTAQKHVSNVLKKMSAASRTEAAVRAVRERLVY